MGFLDEIIDTIRGDRTTRLDYDDPQLPRNAISSRALQALRDRRIKQFSMPPNMKREDWEVCIHYLRDFVNPELTPQGESFFWDTFNLVDSTMHHAISRGGTVYFPPDQIRANPSVNIAFQIAHGDEIEVLKTLLMILLFVSILWKLDDDDTSRMHLMDLWDLLQTGELSNSRGEWIEYGPLKPIDFKMQKRVNVIRDEDQQQQKVSYNHANPGVQANSTGSQNASRGDDPFI